MNYHPYHAIAGSGDPLIPVLEKKYPLYVVKEEGEPSSLANEIRNWFNPLNMYVYLWQPVRLRNYFYTRHPFFQAAFRLPHFRTCWENICKGSFAYNTFLFKKPAFSSHYHHSFLADLTCLALLFGDEFIDGICNELGKNCVLQLLDDKGKNFYLHIKKDKDGYPELHYDFDLYQLLPPAMWTLKNEKYGIHYARFYELLKDLLNLMNQWLKKMELNKAINTAGKIKEACDLCFDTYIHDVKEPPLQNIFDSDRPAMFWHDRKNRSIQEKLLELRCILLNKNFDKYKSSFPGWLDIISTMQVYDDMQDCRTDENFQDNLLLVFAANRFPEEMEWFRENKSKFYDDDHWRMLISRHMPCSVYLCTHFSKEKIYSMKWVQKKICNYLWKHNWFASSRYCYHEKYLESCAADKSFNELLNDTSPVLRYTGSETEWKSYTLEIAFHSRSLKKYILSKAGWREKYFLYFNFLHLSSYEKARLADKVAGEQGN